MRALITGAEGFAGGHLLRHLRTNNPSLELHGTVRPGFEDPARLNKLLDSAISLDLRDFAVVHALLDSLRPDYIYHLAAQAFVPRSFEDPWETLENNIRSQANILHALVELGQRPHVLVVSSAEIYGSVPPEQTPVTEDLPFMPSNPYSVSKIGQDMLGLQYFLSHQMPVIRARPFNHIGPGQNPNFVAPAFATQIARIERGLQPPVMQVGDLSPQRDFADVRDVVRAYQMALEHGQPGAAYNICRGKAYSIQYLLNTLLSYSPVEVEVQVDPSRLRVVDRPVVLGSYARLNADTGWTPTISFEQSLRDVLESCRERVAEEQAATSH